MPFIIIEGYRFGFYSLDQDEPPRVHVFRRGSEAKIRCALLNRSRITATINVS